MGFLAVLLALLLEQARPLAFDNPVHAGLRSWARTVRRNLDAGQSAHGWLAWLLAAGVPALAFDWHPHEAANAELLEQWGCGHASRSVDVLAGILETWAAPTGRLDAAREATQRVARQAFGAEQMRPILDQLFGPRGAA